MGKWLKVTQRSAQSLPRTTGKLAPKDRAAVGVSFPAAVAAESVHWAHGAEGLPVSGTTSPILLLTE